MTVASAAAVEGRLGLIREAVALLLRAEALETSSRGRSAIRILRRELMGDELRGAGRPSPGPVQIAMMAAIAQEGPLSAVALRRYCERPAAASRALGGLVARGYVEAIPRRPLATLWGLTDSGRAWLEAFEARMGAS